jgi:hypothetical protein
MGKVISSASMSLDGFIDSPDNTLGSLFDWYNSGDIEVATAINELAFMLTPQVPNTGAAGLLSWEPSARGTRCLSSDDQQR